MERNTQQAVENQDLPALTRALTRIAGMAPERAWDQGPTGWRAIAEQGAQAAQSGDFRGARASCKQCHNAWRERYRREYRLRPVPGT